MRNLSLTLLVSMVCGGVALLGAGEVTPKKSGCACGSTPVARTSNSGTCFAEGQCICPVYTWGVYGSGCFYYCVVCENGQYVGSCGMVASCGLPYANGCPGGGMTCEDGNCIGQSQTSVACLDGEQLRIENTIAKRGMTSVPERPISNEVLEKNGELAGLKVLSNEVVNVRDPEFGDTITVQLVLLKGNKMQNMMPKSILAPVIAFGWQIAEDKSAPLIDSSLIVKSDTIPSILMTKGNGGASYSIFRKLP